MKRSIWKAEQLSACPVGMVSLPYQRQERNGLEIKLQDYTEMSRTESHKSPETKSPLSLPSNEWKNPYAGTSLQIFKTSEMDRIWSKLLENKWHVMWWEARAELVKYQESTGPGVNRPTMVKEARRQWDTIIMVSSEDRQTESRSLSCHLLAV